MASCKPATKPIGPEALWRRFQHFAKLSSTTLQCKRTDSEMDQLCRIYFSRMRPVASRVTPPSQKWTRRVNNGTRHLKYSHVASKVGPTCLRPQIRPRRLQSPHLKMDLRPQSSSRRLTNDVNVSKPHPSTMLKRTLENRPITFTPARFSPCLQPHGPPPNCF
jgi:hypothetical protein